jgi:hypothetical protein
MNRDRFACRHGENGEQERTALIEKWWNKLGGTWKDETYPDFIGVAVGILDHYNVNIHGLLVDQWWGIEFSYKGGEIQMCQADDLIHGFAYLLEEFVVEGKDDVDDKK